MLRLDTNTLHELRTKNISELTVRIISGGCAGNKIEVLLERPEVIENHVDLGDDALTIWVAKDDQKNIDDGVLTKTPKSWIFTHPNIQSRCGCATSFSFEKK